MKTTFSLREGQTPEQFENRPTIELDDTCLGLWYVQMERDQNLIAGVNVLPDGSGLLKYRFRYGADPDPFGGKDKKSAYVVSTETPAQAIECARVMIKECFPGKQYYELLRGTGTTEQMIRQWIAMPFVHTRRIDP